MPGDSRSQADQTKLGERIGEWYAERDRLRAILEHGKDADGWNLSPEAMDNLRADIREVTRTINRLSGELANPEEFATGMSYGA